MGQNTYRANAVPPTHLVQISCHSDHYCTMRIVSQGLLLFHHTLSDPILTGLECSTVKNSGLMRNFTGGDCNSNVSLDLEVEWGRTLSRRRSRRGRAQGLQGELSPQQKQIHSLPFHRGIPTSFVILFYPLNTSIFYVNSCIKPDCS